MAQFTGRTDGPRLALPTGVEVSSYSTYLEAQRAVDHLSDEEFPVQDISIVGTDLRMVEKVLGRLTYGRVALAGALNGAWFGLLIGLLFMFMAPTPGMLLIGPLMGAAFGILAGIVGFALRSRDRDFTSTSQVVASRYAIVADDAVAQRARRELEQAGLAGSARTGAQSLSPARGAAAGPGAPQAPQSVPEAARAPQEPPRYGIRLAPGQSVQDVTGSAPERGGAPRDRGPAPDDRPQPPAPGETR